MLLHEDHNAIARRLHSEIRWPIFLPPPSSRQQIRQIRQIRQRLQAHKRDKSDLQFLATEDFPVSPDHIFIPAQLELRQNVGTPIAPLATRMPHILTEAIRTGWTSEVNKGNSLCLYGLWSLTADPNWYQYRSIDTCMNAFWATGDEQYLELALDDYLLMPLVSDSVSVSHLYEIYYIIRYLIIEPYLVGRYAPKQIEWEHRLITLANQMRDKGGGPRIGDIDQCETYVEYWKFLDGYMGESYVVQKPDVVDWVDEFYTEYTFEGGPRDASSDYEMSTGELRLWAAAGYGKNIFSWFDNWAKQFANFVSVSVSKNYKHAIAWGDQGGDDGGKVHYWHRGPVALLLHALGYDIDNRLLSLGRKLVTPNLAPFSPNSAYPLGGASLQCVVDPKEWMEAPHVEPHDGYVAGVGSGVVGYRVGKHFAQAAPICSFTIGKRPIAWEDHHYASPPDIESWMFDGINIVTHPSGYGIGGNEFHNYNSFGMKCDGWSWLQELIKIVVNDSGFETEHLWYGPFERYYRAIEPHRYAKPNEYDGCEVRSVRRFFAGDKPYMQVQRSWKSPGNTFPTDTENLPVLQQAVHAIAPISRYNEHTLTWEVQGVKVFYTFSMVGGSPTVIIESEPRYLNSQNYYRAFIQSPKDLLVGVLNYKYGLEAEGLPIDLPPVVDPPVDPPQEPKELIYSEGDTEYKATKEELIITTTTITKIPRKSL